MQETDSQAPLMLPYRQLLRPVGAYFNMLQARYLTLEETPEGFSWRCYPEGDKTRQEVGLIPFSSVQELDKTYRQTFRAKRTIMNGLRHLGAHGVRPLPQHPLLPEGYEQLLRSVGAKLDRQQARLAWLVEEDDCFKLCYSLARLGHDEAGRMGMINDYHEEIYRRPQIVTLLSVVRGQRGLPVTP